MYFSTSPYIRTPQKLITAIQTIKTESHTAGLISVLQNCITVAAALSSAGAVIDREYPIRILLARPIDHTHSDDQRRRLAEVPSSCSADCRLKKCRSMPNESSRDRHKSCNFSCRIRDSRSDHSHKNVGK